MLKNRMTINEVCQDLRNIGMGMTQKTVADGIESGAFPFGKVLSVTNGRRHILILRQDYEKWKENMTLGGTKQSATANEPAPISCADWDLISSHTYTQENKDIMWEVIIRGWARKSPADSEK